jgi:two-component sensor histidine kinase
MFYRDGRPVDFQYINVNRAFETQTGLTGVNGKLVSEVIPGIRQSDPELFERYGRIALTGKPESFEMYVASLHMWFSISVYSPQREYFVAIFDVITERKLAEEKVLASLAEKETLLKEVHHRVKNNMQVISSLLRLQERKVKDKDSAAILKDSQNRIQSMALVYNKLYRSENLAGINMTEYINELTLGLVKSYAVNPSRVTVKIDPVGVFLDVDQAIPCGMVINELVTNSLKYAFPDSRKGQIFISLKEEVDHTLELVVSDNGVGIPENINFDNTSTLGIKLVSNLVRDQLGGKMELNRSRGTTVRITFPRVKEEK